MMMMIMIKYVNGKCQVIKYSKAQVLPFWVLFDCLLAKLPGRQVKWSAGLIPFHTLPLLVGGWVPSERGGGVLRSKR
jgi:hypothetical protein